MNIDNYMLIQRIWRKNKYISWSRILGGLNSTGFRGYLNRQDGTVEMFRFNPRSDKKKKTKGIAAVDGYSEKTYT